MLVEEDKLDLIHDAIEDSKEKAHRMVDTETLEHKEARDRRGSLDGESRRIIFSEF